MTRPAAELEQEAAAWLARRDGDAWTEADAAALERWRCSSTAHHIAMLRLETVWNKADRLRAVAPAGHSGDAVEEEDGGTVVHITRARDKTLRWYLPLAAAAALAALAVPAWQMLQQPGSQSYATAVGGFQRLPLADGSRVELNTDSRLEVAFTRAEREVQLDQGEAFFTVAHDAARPFVVHAGEYRVTAIGTAFSVRRQGDRISVAVTEGRVRVDRASGASAAPLVFVAAGQRIEAAPAAAVAVQAVTAVALEQDLSWRDGMLSFEEKPLAAVAAEFNRYNVRQLVVDPSVADVAISGSFRANNLDGFLRLLEQGFGVQPVPRGASEVRLQRG